MLQKSLLLRGRNALCLYVTTHKELRLMAEPKSCTRIINKAKRLCQNRDISVVEHFIGVNKLSKRANN